jgi:hypothetical protein
MAGRLTGVACAIFGVAFGILGVPAGWLWWLFVDMLTAMGTDMGRLGWATEGGRGGLPAVMLEFDGCMGTELTIGDDISAGVGCRMIGEDAAWGGCDT